MAMEARTMESKRTSENLHRFLTTSKPTTSRLALFITKLNMHLSRVYISIKDPVGDREDVSLAATPHQQGEPDQKQ